jgi:hypothetical protein
MHGDGVQSIVHLYSGNLYSDKQTTNQQHDAQILLEHTKYMQTRKGCRAGRLPGHRCTTQ